MFNHLLHANAYRGNQYHSITTFYDDDSFIIQKERGPASEISDTNDVKRVIYWLGHTQAPTGSIFNIHPAEYENQCLWHNGLIKNHEATEWDTLSILKSIVDNGFSSLSDFDGSFACVLLNKATKGSLIVFRNELSPLFYDHEMNLSSTKVNDNFNPVEPNRVFELDIHQKALIPTDHRFVTKDNPYFFF